MPLAVAGQDMGRDGVEVDATPVRDVAFPAVAAELPSIDVPDALARAEDVRA
jgi:hypothetical protein